MPTTNSCLFELHDGLTHVYTADRCTDCSAGHHEDFKALSVERIRELFYETCCSYDHPLMQEVLYWYQFHSTPGHTCSAPYYCYEHNWKTYYGEYAREAWDYALMPKEKPQPEQSLFGTFGTDYEDYRSEDLQIFVAEDPCELAATFGDMVETPAIIHAPLVPFHKIQSSSSLRKVEKNPEEQQSRESAGNNSLVNDNKNPAANQALPISYVPFLARSKRRASETKLRGGNTNWEKRQKLLSPPKGTQNKGCIR